MTNLRLPLDLLEHGGSKRVWRIAGVVVAVLVLAGVAYFGFGGKSLRGFFLSQPELYNLQLSVSKASLTTDGDLKLVYTITNTGSTDVKKETKLVSKVYINSDTVPAFSKPWNVDSSVAFRAGESVSYQMKVPRAMFPKETYSVSESGANPPSVSTVKKLSIALFGTNDQGQEDKITATSTLTF